MRYREFGNSGISASEIGFGAWTIATDWWGKLDRGESLSLLQRALGLGITFFDTADTYGKGYSEELIGEAIRGRRGDVTIGTKFGYDIYSGPEPKGHQERVQNWDPAYIRHALEESLRRLGTDYVDLYQLHNPRIGTVRDDAVFEQMERFVGEGKVRAYGAALGPAIGWEEEGVAALRERGCRSVQTVYNLLEQDPGRTFFREASQAGAGVLVRVPLHSGLLEGIYGPDAKFAAGSHRAFRFREKPDWLEDGLRKLAHLGFLTEGKNRTIAQAALKFILAEPTITSVLPTVTTVEQMEEFVAASDQAELTAEEMGLIADLYVSDFAAAA